MIAVGTLVGAFLSAFFALITYAIAGLGDGLIFQVCFYIFDLIQLMQSQSLSDIVTKYALLALPVTILQAIVLRKHVQIKLALYLGVVNGFSVIIGIEVLIAAENIWLRRSVGFAILFFFILNLLISNFFLDKPIENRSHDSSKSNQKVVTKPSVRHVASTSTTKIDCGELEALSNSNQPSPVPVAIDNINDHDGMQNNKNGVDDGHSDEFSADDNDNSFIKRENGSDNITCTPQEKTLPNSICVSQNDQDTTNNHRITTDVGHDTNTNSKNVEVSKSANFGDNDANVSGSGMNSIEGCHAWSAVLGTGLISGFMYGLFGIGGPPWMIVSI